MAGERIIDPEESEAMAEAWDTLVDAHDVANLSQLREAALNKTITRGGSAVSALVITQPQIMADLALYLTDHPSQMTEKGEQYLREGVAREFPITSIFRNW